MPENIKLKIAGVILLLERVKYDFDSLVPALTQLVRVRGCSSCCVKHAGTAMSPVQIREAGLKTGLRFEKEDHISFVFCPGSVVAHHEALSRLRLGFKSRLGRFSILI